MIRINQLLDCNLFGISHIMLSGIGTVAYKAVTAALRMEYLFWLQTPLKSSKVKSSTAIPPKPKNKKYKSSHQQTFLIKLIFHESLGRQQLKRAHTLYVKIKYKIIFVFMLLLKIILGNKFCTSNELIFALLGMLYLILLIQTSFCVAQNCS